MTKIELLSAIADAQAKNEDGVTASDVSATAARMNELEADGLLSRPKVKGITALRKTGGRGRPSHLFKLTSKATKRVKRYREQDAESQTEATVKATEATQPTAVAA